MNDVAARGRLTVRPNSWHYRVHAWWASEKGKDERPTDLCHYFWRVILWAPLRFFFTKGPAVVIAVLAVAASVGYSILAWGGQIAHALGLVVAAGWLIVLFALGALVSMILVILLFRLLLGWNMEVVDRRINRILDAFVAGWLWFWTQPVVRTRWVGVAPFAFALAALYVLLLFLDWGWTLTVTGMVVGIVGVIVLAIVGVVFFADFVKDRRERKAELKPKRDDADVEPREVVVREPSWSGLRMLWAFLVAKKHRVCPLIEVRP